MLKVQAQVLGGDHEFVEHIMKRARGLISPPHTHTHAKGRRNTQSAFTDHQEKVQSLRMATDPHNTDTFFTQCTVRDKIRV